MFSTLSLWTFTSASNPIAAQGDQYSVKRILSVYWIQMWEGKREEVIFFQDSFMLKIISRLSLDSKTTSCVTTEMFS